MNHFLTRSATEIRDGSAVATAIRDTRCMLIEYGDGSCELYDLAHDPYDAQNLITPETTPALDTISQGVVDQRPLREWPRDLF